MQTVCGRSIAPPLEYFCCLDLIHKSKKRVKLHISDRGILINIMKGQTVTCLLLIVIIRRVSNVSKEANIRK